MKSERVQITAFLTLAALDALLALVSPRVIYTQCAAALGHFATVYCDTEYTVADVLLGNVAMCLLPYLIYRCRRAAVVIIDLKRRTKVAEPVTFAEAVAEAVTIPVPLVLALVSLPLMPLWLAPLVASFGKWAAMAAAVWWMVVALSTLCYVGALCVYESECRGERPSTALLSAGYNLGGAPGVWLAYKSLPRSRTLAEMVKLPPTLAVFFGAVVVITVLVKMS